MVEDNNYVSEGELSHIKELAEVLTGLFDEAYARYKPLVKSVLNDQVFKERDIERIMDGLLDFGEDPRFVELYRKLCRHVYSRYPKLVTEHVNLFREQHMESEENRVLE